jgi:hypothetical protein
VLRRLVLLAVALSLTSCGGDAEQRAAEAGCNALASGNWEELGEQRDLLTDEGDYAELGSDFGEVVRFAIVENPDIAPGIEVLGPKMAVDDARAAFDDAWVKCGTIDDSMPALIGDEYQAGWDDIGINLARIFG